MDSWYSLAGDGLRWLYDRRISAPPILNAAAKFPASAEFVAAWEGLRDEALSVAERLHEVPRFHEVMKQQEEISANDGRDWRTFVIKAYGANIARNLSRCPVLAELLERHPEVVSATFSYLAPGKHIPLHRGPFRGVLRFHLGLSMPRDDKGDLGATLWINGVPYLLANGDCLLWDDTYPHEVLNATNDVRIALLLDVLRPGMPSDMKLLSSLVISAIGTMARFKPGAFAG